MIVRALEVAAEMLEDSAVKSEPDAAELRAPVMRALAGYIKRERARSRYMSAAEYVPHRRAAPRRD